MMVGAERQSTGGLQKGHGRGQDSTLNEGMIMHGADIKY